MRATGRSIKRAPFAKKIPRAERRVSGRTAGPRTPVAVRTSGLDVEPELRERIQERLGLRLGKFAAHIERVTVRFEDVNGPRRGIDVACKLKIVLSGLESVVVAELAGSAAEAFARADHRAERAVKRALGKGRARGRIERVQVRAPVATRPRGARRSSAGAGKPAGTAARNYKRRTRKAVVALEDSATQHPSRKTTRGSANRARHANKLTRREQRRVSSPTARRAQAARTDRSPR
jgi:hypothetical protein